MNESGEDAERKKHDGKNDGTDAVIEASPSEVEQFAAEMGSDTPWHYDFRQRRDKQGKVKAEGAYVRVVGRPEPDAWGNHLFGGGTALTLVLNCADQDGKLRLVRRAVLDIDEYSKEKQKQLLRKIK